MRRDERIKTAYLLGRQAAERQSRVKTAAGEENPDGILSGIRGILPERDDSLQTQGKRKLEELYYNYLANETPEERALREREQMIADLKSGRTAHRGLDYVQNLIYGDDTRNKIDSVKETARYGNAFANPFYEAPAPEPSMLERAQTGASDLYNRGVSGAKNTYSDLEARLKDLLSSKPAAPAAPGAAPVK